MPEPTRVQILGGKFPDATAALKLERILARDSGVEITGATSGGWSLFWTCARSSLRARRREGVAPPVARELCGRRALRPEPYNGLSTVVGTPGGGARHDHAPRVATRTTPAQSVRRTGERGAPPSNPPGADHS